VATNLTYAQSIESCKILHKGNFTYGYASDLIEVNHCCPIKIGISDLSCLSL